MSNTGWNDRENKRGNTK